MKSPTKYRYMLASGTAAALLAIVAVINLATRPGERQETPPPATSATAAPTVMPVNRAAPTTVPVTESVDTERTEVSPPPQPAVKEFEEIADKQSVPVTSAGDTRVSDPGDEALNDGSLAALRPDAVIVYEYVYGDGTESAEEAAPRFLSGKTYAEVLKLFGEGGAFEGFTCAEFSPDRVVLRKSLDDLAKSYIIGTYGGKVAVFFADSGKSRHLRQVTEKPVSALSEAEREKLAAGFTVTGDEELFRVLQDYDS